MYRVLDLELFLYMYMYMTNFHEYIYMFCIPFHYKNYAKETLTDSYSKSLSFFLNIKELSIFVHILLCYIMYPSDLVSCWFFGDVSFIPIGCDRGIGLFLRKVSPGLFVNVKSCVSSEPWQSSSATLSLKQNNVLTI